MREQERKAKIAEQLLQDELKLLSKLDHPNIVHVIELLHDDDYYYFVMELIQEGNLMEYEDKLVKHEIDL